MRVNDCFPSKYLKASDLPQAQFIPVQIREVVVETMDGGEAEMKPIVYFLGKNKGLVLNKTNANIISEAYGEETDVWAGKPLLLYVTDTTFQGRPTPCIRVKVPSPPQSAKPAAKTHAPAATPQPPAGNLLPDYPKPSSTPPAPLESAGEQQHVPIEEDQIPF